MKVLLLLCQLSPSSIVQNSILTCLYLSETFSLTTGGDYHCYKKRQFSLHHWQNFSLSNMATLRNKKKLAAVFRETPENTRNTQSRNTIDPEKDQECISQVSEEIEGRVTKKLSKEFSRTEARILDALSKLDDFLLNPQVRTCSVAVPGTSRNSNSENREPTEERSLADPCPEVRYSSHHSGYLNSPEVEDYPHTTETMSKKLSGKKWREVGKSRQVLFFFHRKVMYQTRHPSNWIFNTPSKIQSVIETFEVRGVTYYACEGIKTEMKTKLGSSFLFTSSYPRLKTCELLHQSVLLIFTTFCCPNWRLLRLWRVWFGEKLLEVRSLLRSFSWNSLKKLADCHNRLVFFEPKTLHCKTLWKIN